MGLIGDVISFARGGSSNSDDAKIQGIRTISNLAYSTDAVVGHFLDLAWSMEPLDPLPTVIYFNGASFGHTNRSRSEELCRVIAKRGYAVMNVEFRDIRKNVGIKEEIEDIQKILDWIATNHEKFKLDLKNVYILGSSYGALMALWMAMMFNSKRLRNIVNLREPGIEIKGLGLLTGMTDIYSGESRMKNIRNSFKDLRGTNRELAEAMDPWTNHDLREMPPIFQVTAAYDSARADVAKLDELLDNNKLPHETVTFEGNERMVRSFMEKHPYSNETTRTLSRMFTFFKDNQ